ncbi:MAG: hypothetical protein L6R35_004647 [Caloplaca aegaea]|nr:MAG: hypothetical protein L6R35_004647 [Caloplaca aegaea]
MASPCNDNKRCSRHGRSTEAKAVRNAAILILYLLLAAGIFGSVLLYSIVWFTRCRDAVAVSHTASEFAQAYAGMDPTKTHEFKASFNSTTRRVLDDKLPMLISRTCVTAVFYVKAYDIGQGVAETPEAESPCHKAGKMDGPGQDCIQIPMATGYMNGYQAAAAVWSVLTVLIILDYSMSDSNVPGSWILDGDNFTCLQGLLFSVLPALGALVSTASASYSRTCQETPTDEEMGYPETH